MTIIVTGGAGFIGSNFIFHIKVSFFSNCSNSSINFLST